MNAQSLLQQFALYHRRLNKFTFYLSHAYLELLPRQFFSRSYQEVIKKLAQLPDEKQQQILMRVDYYHRLQVPFKIENARAMIGNFKRQKPSTYYFDLARLLRYFPADRYFDYLFGDVIHIPETPSFVKSRPITSENENSILLKLDSVRHFYVMRDKLPFERKKPLLVWRGAAHQIQRQKFLEQYHHLSCVDVGCVHEKSRNKPYHRAYLTIPEQLKYKYILSIEGNDVATNLKWIMYSNSLCFMTVPKYETWLMEGALQANVHYVALRDDYSDLEEKIDFYERYPEAALEIIQNAQIWMQQFMNKEEELLVSLLVMQKYFQLSGQIN